MNQIDVALYSKLTASAATALLSTVTSVYNHVAPQSANEPYIIYGKQAGAPQFTLGTVAYETTLYMVKAVTQEPSAKVAGSIATLIDDTLNDGTLTISGYTTMYMRRETAIDFAEVGPAGEVFHHRGASYRIWADPA